MELPGVQLTLYAAKLALTETALLAPYLVLGLLGRALLRETRQRRYRWQVIARCDNPAALLPQLHLPKMCLVDVDPFSVL